MGCLSLLAVGSAGWAIGRLPDLAAQVSRDTAAASPAVTPVAITSPPPAVLPAAMPAPAPAPMIITMPAAPPPQIIIVRDGRAGDGYGQRTAASEPAELKWTLPRSDGVPAGPQRAATAAPEPVADVSSTDQVGFALATMAYDDLARGDRRGAAAKFESALGVAPAADNAPAWKRELKRLKKRWSGEGYTLLRDNGDDGLVARPVLGGGQTGAQLAYTPMPLSRRPIYVVLRATTANSGGFSRTTGTPNTEIAAGVKWQVLPQLSVSGERLFAVDAGARDAWTVRLAGGGAHRFGRLLTDGYAEAGVVGFSHPDWFGGAQARAVLPFSLSAFRFEPGVGIWGGVQRGGYTVGRVDLGPTLGVVWDKWKVRASADYRLKVAGNAKPGSGPAVTVSGAF